jgi:signal recognition particle subunit SRP54
MGDVVGLIQDFEDVVDQKKAEQDALRMMQGQFTLEDFLNQVRTIQKMGSLKDLMEKIPGLSGMMPPGAAAQVDDKELVRIEAMIQSMTRFERDDPNVLVREPSRVKRISKGSGQPEQGVAELVQKFLFMQQMMGGMGQDLGFLGNIPGMKGLGLARNMRRAMKSGKLSDALAGMQGGGFPGAGMPGGFPGMGMPGMGMPGMGFPGMGMPGMAGGGEPGNRMKVLSKAEKNAKKNQRKRERDARKKGKGKR